MGRLRTLFIATAYLVALVAILSGCRKRHNIITSNDFDNLELGSFSEPGFPFITTSLNARKLGAGFPKNNISARTLAINVGDSAYVCFDTDLLRWSVAWTGKFLPMVTMAQISYDDFFNKADKVPAIPENPKIATGMYAGWAVKRPDFNDPRRSADNDIQIFGPIPEALGRWNGTYLYGDEVVLSYAVNHTAILENPGSIRFGEEVAFTRNFELDKLQDSLYLIAAEVTDGFAGETDSTVVWTYNGSNRDSVTVLGIVTNDINGLRPEIQDNRYFTVLFPETTAQVNATVVMWRGPAEKKEEFLQLLDEINVKMPDFRDGSTPYWKEAVYTKGILSPDTAAYVTDILTLPLPNPWKRNVRVADMAFFEDGRAAAVTFSGDIWIVEGINSDLKELKWNRFASGLYEPMSIEIVDNTIYTFGKEGIVRFHDLNKDGVADYYENFFNKTEQSLNSREWASDMVRAPDGSFYIAKGGIGGSRQRGSIWKVSPDGRNAEPFASGIRDPHLGMHPEKGILSASDQQGNYVPATPILLVNKGDYFGYPTSPESAYPDISPPLTWIPHYIDPSSIGQVWITGGEMGPLNEQMVHFSHSRPGLFRILMDSTSKSIQGGVSFMPANYPAPLHKGVINPIDGQLYITGFNLWGSSSKGVSALLRFRYTGKPFYLPERFKAGEQGVVLRFGEELNPETAKDPQNFQVKRWNYKRTSDYGSGHFKLDGTSGEELLPVLQSYLSKDQKAVFLIVPNMTEVMQMQLSYQLKSVDGAIMDDDFCFTVKNIEKIDAGGEGFDDSLKHIAAVKLDIPAEQAVEGQASIENGAKLFKTMACAGCHSPGLATDGFYGPPFKGLFNSERQFEDGSSAIADEDYLKEAILEPSKSIVKGYDAEMPPFMGVLSEPDIESIILYIKSLSEE